MKKNSLRYARVYVSWDKHWAQWCVVPCPNCGGASGRHFSTKRAALDAAVAAAKKLATELVIKNKNGRIAYRNSYGNDPRSRRG